MRVRTELLAAKLERECKEEGHTMENASVIRPGSGIRIMTAVEQYMPQLMVLGCKFCGCREGDQMLTLIEQTQWRLLWIFKPCTINVEP